jgi:L-lysine exporter family protein LysE/ArgO
MLAAAIDGFLLGGSLIVAIGAQNAFVLRQGLKREFVLPICLICALSDALLIAAGVAGLGTLVRQSPTALTLVTMGGAAFLFLYGSRAFARAARPGALAVDEGRAPRLAAAVAACLAFTFLNPHVYLDTVLLLGSLSGRYAGTARLAYGTGAAAASFAWFFGLGYGARLLAPIFADPRAWRILDIGIAIVMWALAARLFLGLGEALNP